MKKIILALVVLVFAAPAWAEVVITCAQVGDTNEVVISFDASGETNLVRAFSLNIQLDDEAVILDVGNVNADYYIHPGTIQIDTSTTPPTINYGTPVAEYDDLQSDTLLGIDSNGVTIEMGSLYYPTEPGSVNAPAKSGVLLSLYVSEPADFETCLTISGNVARAGSSGVVMEDPDEVVTVNATGCCVVFPSGTCWTATECAGQTSGDATCDGKVNLDDLAALKAAWGLIGPYTPPLCCADFTQDNKVNLDDLAALKAGWGGTGITPSTGNQTCPP